MCVWRLVNHQKYLIFIKASGTIQSELLRRRMRRYQCSRANLYPKVQGFKTPLSKNRRIDVWVQEERFHLFFSCSIHDLNKLPICVAEGTLLSSVYGTKL